MPYAYLGTFYNAQKGISKVSLPFCAWSAVMWVFYHNPSLGPIPDLKLTDSCLSDIWKATSQNFFFFWFCWDLGGMEPQVSGMLAKQGYICLHPRCNLNWHFLYCVSVGFISSVENVCISCLGTGSFTFILCLSVSLMAHFMDLITHVYYLCHQKISPMPTTLRSKTLFLFYHLLFQFILLPSVEYFIILTQI